MMGLEGKLIYIFGPPLSGKTTIVRKIAEEYNKLDINILSYESFNTCGGYKRFYSEIEQSIKKHDLTVCESVNCDFGDKYRVSFIPKKYFIVFVDIKEEVLSERIKSFSTNAPVDILKARINNFRVKELISLVRFPKIGFYRSTNDKLNERIKNFVFNK